MAAFTNNVVTVRPMAPPDTSNLVEVDVLPDLPDDDFPVRTLVALNGAIYRACIGEWTSVVVDGYEIIGTGPAWGPDPQHWSGYAELNGKHGAWREAEQLARRFAAELVIEVTP